MLKRENPNGPTIKDLHLKILGENIHTVPYLCRFVEEIPDLLNVKMHFRNRVEVTVVLI